MFEILNLCNRKIRIGSFMCFARRFRFHHPNLLPNIFSLNSSCLLLSLSNLYIAILAPTIGNVTSTISSIVKIIDYPPTYALLFYILFVLSSFLISTRNLALSILIF